MFTEANDCSKPNSRALELCRFFLEKVSRSHARRPVLILKRNVTSELFRRLVYKKGKNRWKIFARFLVSFEESFVFLERVQFHEGCRSFACSTFSKSRPMDFSCLCSLYWSLMRSRSGQIEL